MAFEHCDDEIATVLGRDLSGEERTELRKLLSKRKRLEKNAEADEAFMADAKDFGDFHLAKKLNKRRQAWLGLKIRLDRNDFLKRQFPDDPALGIEAMLGGINRVDSFLDDDALQGATRKSTDATQKARVREYMGGFAADMEAEGVMDAFKNNIHEEQVADALGRKSGADMSDLNPDAVKIAKVISKWLERTRIDKNKLGAMIGKLEGRVGIQTHDPFKMRRAKSILTDGKHAHDGETGTANRDAWKEEVMGSDDLDRVETFKGIDEEDIDQYLNDIYDSLVSGVHLSHLHTSKSDVRGLGLPSNVADALSAQRLIVWKNGAGWLNYNKKFGNLNLRDSIIADLGMSGQRVGLMETMGPNPEATFAGDIEAAERLVRHGGAARRSKVEGLKEGFNASLFKVVSGETNRPAVGLLARIGVVSRAIQAMSKLGFATLSSIADTFIIARTLKMNGVDTLSPWGQAFKAILSPMSKGDRRQFALMMGAGTDGIRSAIARRFDGLDDSISGNSAKGLQLYFRLNALEWWTETARESVFFTLSKHMALSKGRGFNKLNKEFKTTLRQYGVDEDIWNAMRTHAVRKVDGQEFFDAELARTLPDDVIDAILERRGTKLTKKKKERGDLRLEMERKFRTYFSDQMDFAVVEPDARTRVLLTGAQRPGTVLGEAIRHLMLFKAFPIAVLQRPLGREIFGRGASTNNPFKALGAGNGELTGFMSFMAASAVFGYVAMSAKDILKGKEPRLPDTPVEFAKVLTASLLQGGGLGLFGDFLFGELKTRYGGGPISALMGPTVGSAEQLINVLGNWMEGDPAAAQLFGFAKTHTPGANLFYTKMLLDYNLFYALQEQASPGFARRTERRLRKENDQGYLDFPIFGEFSPTEAVR